jgi:hypothetical protein
LPTLGVVSTDADDRSSRLSDALDAIFTNGRERETSDDSDRPAISEDEPYELPDIVPATDETEAPRLPERTDLAPRAPGTAAVTGAVTGAVHDAAGPTGRLVEPPVGPPPVTAPVTTPATTPAPVTSPVPAAVPGTEPARPATAWGDHMPAAVAATPGVSQLRTPGRRPRVRRVTRVLRHLDPWSTFKVALLFSAVGYVVALTSGVLLWRVADSTGTLDNVERWFTQFGWETFELKGGEIFHNAWIIGLFGVVAATGAAVLLATLFNLVSDIVGGIRMTVLEEEVVERTISSTRRYVVRTPPTDAIAGRGSTAPSWSVDDDERSDVTAGGHDARHADAPTAVSAVVGDADLVDQRHDTTRTTPTEPTQKPPTADWSVD